MIDFKNVISANSLIKVQNNLAIHLVFHPEYIPTVICFFLKGLLQLILIYIYLVCKVCCSYVSDYNIYICKNASLYEPT